MAFSPEFHLLFSQISQKLWGRWVGSHIWENFLGPSLKPKQVHFIGFMIGIWSGLAYFELLSSLPMGRRVGAKIPTSESFFQQGPMKGSYQSPGNKQHCIGHFGMEIVDPPWATMTKHCLLTHSQKWRLKPTLETPALTLESLATKCHQM